MEHHVCFHPHTIVCGIELLTPDEKSIDIWSLGVTMFSLLSGTQPFPVYPENTLRRCISSGSYFFPAHRFKNVSKDAKDLIISMIKVNPNERITAEEALKHKWFTSNSMANSQSYCSMSSLLSDEDL